MKQLAYRAAPFVYLVSSLLVPGSWAQTGAGPGPADSPHASWVQVMLDLRRAASPAAEQSAARRSARTRLQQLDVPHQDAAATLQWLWERHDATDWFLQDQAALRGWSEQIDVPRDFAWYLNAARDARPEAALIRHVLAELADQGVAWRNRLEQWEAQQVSPDDPCWLELYVDACQARRRQRLQSLVQQAPRIVFTKHYTLGGSHYAYTEGLSDAQAERHFVPGTALGILAWDGTDYRAETLVRDDTGVIRDPDVSWNGRRILFAWKKSDRQDDYHLYELDVSTRSVPQLTHGLGVADYEGAYLPGGDIIFNSTRCVQTVDCWWTEVSNLYRCDGDGQLLRRLAFDQVHDNFPTVTPDGRILYTRWEYNDRGQIYPQPLLQMNADGTHQREFYGGNSFFPTTILHARAIPGGNRVLAIATGHHARQTGKLIEIDPGAGRQENHGVQLVAPVRDTPADRVDAYGQSGELFQYPYPLSDRQFLVTYHPGGWSWRHGPLGPLFGIYWMDRQGRRELLWHDPQLPCSQPVPLTARRQPRVFPSQVDYRQDSATCYIQDVYAGTGCANVPRGTVQRLRVVALDFRAAGIGSNRNHGPGGGALISTPVAIGNGAWDPKRILGEAMVQPDGSAYFCVPARTPLYFQLLDQRGQLVQTMRSWTTLQPGENASCVGCHEHPNSVPLAQRPLSDALRQGPERLRPRHGLSDGFSFSHYVQPILDQHCVRCHDGQPGVGYDLTNAPVPDRDAKRIWSRSYLELTHATRDERQAPHDWRGDANHPLVNWVSAESAPPALAPYPAGSARSGLMQLLDQGHEGIQLTSAQREILAAWIDLGVPFCGTYEEASQWSVGERDLYRRFVDKRTEQEELEREQLQRLAEGGD